MAVIALALGGIDAQKDTFQKNQFIQNLVVSCNRPEYAHLWTS